MTCKSPLQRFMKTGDAMIVCMQCEVYYASFPYVNAKYCDECWFKRIHCQRCLTKRSSPDIICICTLQGSYNCGYILCTTKSSFPTLYPNLCHKHYRIKNYNLSLHYLTRCCRCGIVSRELKVQTLVNLVTCQSCAKHVIFSILQKHTVISLMDIVYSYIQ